MSRRSRKRLIPAPYKSWFEYEVHQLMNNHEYEPAWAVASYTIEAKYHPDLASYSEPYVYYEIKGYFRTFEEAKKYIWVRKSHPEIQIRFIIADPNKRAYPQTRMKMGDWLTKNGFEWCTKESIPEEWK